MVTNYEFFIRYIELIKKKCQKHQRNPCGMNPITLKHLTDFSHNSKLARLSSEPIWLQTFPNLIKFHCSIEWFLAHVKAKH